MFEEDLKIAKDNLLKETKNGDVSYCVCNITKENDIIDLIKFSKEKYKKIDFWINNAGVNQPDKMIWELSTDEINRMIDIDLKGTIVATKCIMNEMIKENNGAIYTVEGHGSNDAIIPGISIYGTSKRGVTYFINALAKEINVNNYNIIVGALSPGIMITDFLVNSFRDNKMELSEKNKKVYNILGDYPDVVANYLVNKILNNKKNNVRFSWLSNYKAFWRFMTCMFNKRNFFK